jgi:transcriptional regulator with XRE-family HTH domain
VVRGRRNPAYYGLPDRLRQARRRSGIGMTAASTAIGSSTAAAYLIERRQSLPRINTVERFAKLLGVSPSWLAYGEGEPDAVPSESTVAGLGQRLIEARQAKGLSRQALGQQAGLTGQTVANIEVHGMIPRVDTVEMLAKTLEVAPSWLAFGSALVICAPAGSHADETTDPRDTETDRATGPRQHL